MGRKVQEVGRGRAAAHALGAVVGSRSGQTSGLSSICLQVDACTNTNKSMPSAASKHGPDILTAQIDQRTPGVFATLDRAPAPTSPCFKGQFIPPSKRRKSCSQDLFFNLPKRLEQNGPVYRDPRGLSPTSRPSKPAGPPPWLAKGGRASSVR